MPGLGVTGRKGLQYCCHYTFDCAWTFRSRSLIDKNCNADSNAGDVSSLMSRDVSSNWKQESKKQKIDGK